MCSNLITTSQHYVSQHSITLNCACQSQPSSGTTSRISHTGEELTTEQRENFRSLIDDDLQELLQLVDLPHVSRQWDHAIETLAP
jgi:uncharacterized membrane protein